MPWRAVLLTGFLTVAGLALFIAGFALQATGAAHALPLLVLGALLFLPGAYHAVLAYKAARGAPGYTFDALPEL